MAAPNGAQLGFGLRPSYHPSPHQRETSSTSMQSQHSAGSNDYFRHQYAGTPSVPTVREFYTPGRRSEEQPGPPLSIYTPIRPPQYPLRSSTLWPSSDRPMTPRLNFPQISTPYVNAATKPPPIKSPSIGTSDLNVQRKPKIPFHPNPLYTTPLSEIDTHPTYVDCPWCNSRSLTRVEKENGEGTQKVARILSLFLVVPYILPYAFRWCQDLGHYCESCGSKIVVQRYTTETMSVHRAELCGPPLPPRPNSKICLPKSRQHEQSGRQELAGQHELAAENIVPEIDGQMIAEAEGSIAAAEMESPRAPVHEMEHVNRGVGTQKRIRDRLVRLPK